jgi:hypothetical protein
MKTFPLLLIILAIAGRCITASAEGAKVNAQDTIVFDLSNVSYNNDYAAVPVYILSDDTVNALDFSFRFDESNLFYDSTFILNNYLSTLSYFNPNDRTYRFTSSSFLRIENNKPLVRVRFIMLSGKKELHATDLNTLKGYLNGDACSVKVIDGILTGNMPPDKYKDAIEVYPNPANTSLHILVKDEAAILLLDMNGKPVVAPFVANANQMREINTETLPNGIYILKIANDKWVSIKQVIISK